MTKTVDVNALKYELKQLREGHLTQEQRIQEVMAERNALQRQLQTYINQDYETKSYDLSQKESRRLKRFLKHTKRCAGVVSLSYTNTGIGTATEASCTCGEDEDLTDYSTWY